MQPRADEPTTQLSRHRTTNCRDNPHQNKLDLVTKHPIRTQGNGFATKAHHEWTELVVGKDQRYLQGSLPDPQLLNFDSHH